MTRRCMVLLLAGLASACARSGDPEEGAAAPPRPAAAPAPPAAPAPDSAPAPAPAPAADSAPPARSASPAAAPGPAGWTAGIVRRDHPVSGVATLREVRVATNEGFDRMVFEFQGGELPGYHLEYVDRPVRACGSGNVVEVAGDAWLSVRLEPARAHDDQGGATVRRRSFRPQTRVIREMTLICDFEAQLEWVAGVGTPNRFRVLELRDPTRLVVDVRH